MLFIFYWAVSERTGGMGQWYKEKGGDRKMLLKMLLNVSQFFFFFFFPSSNVTSVIPGLF